ncbi:MAG: hypothetical protein FJ279_24855, partial [Planctomycetes bacterium]|nr:hypothetical protein [Planctomycetota bacterium]
HDLYGLNRNAALLSLAEAAAFGGGGIVRTNGPITDPKLNDVQNLYRSHFRQHRGLYDGKRPLAQAAVACFGSQHYYGHGDHLTVAKSIYDTLLEQRLLTDILTLEGCFDANLARYRLIVLPDVRYLSDEHVRSLEAFRRRGGELLVYGDTGKYDQFMRERKENPLAPLRLAPEFDYESLEAKLAALKTKAWPVIEPTGLRDAWENGAVKAAAYVDDPARPRQAILHVLNFNTDLGRDVNRVARVPAVDVRLPLPQGLTPKSVRVIRVEDAKEERLTPSVAAGSASFRVADVGIHTVCVVE